MTNAMNKPEILFLAHRIPYPPNKGDKIRSWQLFSHLTKRFRVHLACFVDNKDDFEYVEFLQDKCESSFFCPLNPKLAKLKSVANLVGTEPLSFRYYNNANMIAAVNEMRSKPLALEVAFSSTMAPYIASAKPDRKRVIDFCDADSEKWLQYAQAASPPISWIYNREGKSLARAEAAIASWADHSFAVTPEEASLLNRNATKRHVDWFSNGVDTEFFNPSAFNGDPNKISDVLFVGAMDYQANIEGVLDFCTHVWPLVRYAAPTAKFTIVGSNPVASIQALHNKNGITVTGRVDDVRPWLADAKVVIAPLRVARGIQNKVLEAMAMAKPVVASAHAMTGINAPADAAIIADGSKEVSEQILRLLANSEQRHTIGARAQWFIQECKSWKAGLSRFDDALTKLGL